LKSPASPGSPNLQRRISVPEILQRQFFFTTRAPCRKVIFAFGQRWHAAN
jgi:hypothetical protein